MTNYVYPYVSAYKDRIKHLLNPLKKMKRIICILTVLLLMTTSGMAQTVDGLFNRYEEMPGAEYKNIGPLLMGFVKMITAIAADNSEEGRVIIKSIKSVKVLDLEECKPEVKQEFTQKVRNLKPWGMELLIQMKDEDENVFIWGKTRRNTVRQLLIITDDKMVRIKGRFDLDKLANMLNSEQQ